MVTSQTLEKLQQPRCHSSSLKSIVELNAYLIFHLLNLTAPEINAISCCKFAIWIRTFVFLVNANYRKSINQTNF